MKSKEFKNGDRVRPKVEDLRHYKGTVLKYVPAVGLAPAQYKVKWDAFVNPVYWPECRLEPYSNGLQRLQNILTNTHPVCYNKDKRKGK